MNKQDIVGIIKKIFMYYGYDVNTSEISDLLAEKGSDHLFIKYEISTNFNSMRHFSNNVDRYGGKGILILESADEKTLSFAREEGLTLWDRSKFESWIGRAVLSGAFEETQEMPPIRDKVSIPEVEEEPAEKEYERTIRLRSVPVNIGKSDASSIAEAKVGSSRSQKLKFVPVWHYNYSFSTQKKFKSRIIDLNGDGEGYIHAITGENCFGEYKDIQENIFVPIRNYEIKQPVIGKRDAVGRALDSIIREHAKEIRLNEMIGDTIIFENKVLVPDPETINLDMELLHIPVWEIKGMGETVEINGYDGKILAIKAYSDAEFI